MQRPNRHTDELLGKMWKTKSARFNAHARLRRKRFYSASATTILAFYVVVISILPLSHITIRSPEAESLLAFISIVTSVFLVIVTLLEGGKNYEREADRMHKCALEISGLYNYFQSLSLSDAEAVRTETAEKYSRILSDTDVHHADVDFLSFRISEWQALKSSRVRLLVDIARFLFLWVGEYWLYAALILIPPIAMVLFHKQLGLF
jgi:hypothetical protein